jgi:hypothetical protein
MICTLDKNLANLVEIDDWKELEQDGMRVSWLTRWPRDDPARPPRWTQVKRLLDAVATIVLSYTTTMLMRSIWVRGRHRHLGEPWDEVFRPVPPELMLADRGIRHHVLADTFSPLATPGEQQSFVINSPASRHHRPPNSRLQLRLSKALSTPARMTIAEARTADQARLGRRPHLIAGILGAVGQQPAARSRLGGCLQSRLTKVAPARAVRREVVITISRES